MTTNLEHHQDVINQYATGMHAAHRELGPGYVILHCDGQVYLDYMPLDQHRRNVADGEMDDGLAEKIGTQLANCDSTPDSFVSVMVHGDGEYTVCTVQAITKETPA